jgi:hypothetical protein
MLSAKRVIFGTELAFFSRFDGDEFWNFEFFSYLSMTSSREIELNEIMNVLMESR